MSDERFKREPGDDTNELTTPDRRYIDRKRPLFRDVKPPTVSPEDIEAGIARYCELMGIPRHEYKKSKARL